METLEKTYNVPSNGVFGGPKQITLRAMTTREEKILYSSRDANFMRRLVKSCCVEPKDLDIGLLHQNDILFLTFALRELTFGNTYEQEITCPECGAHQEVEIDIADMDVSILDTKGLDKKLTVKLPVNGDTLQLKLLSIGESDKIERLVKNKAAKGKLKNPQDYEFLLKLMALIDTRNGEEFESQEEKQNYTDNLHLRDLNTIQNALLKIGFGIDNSNIVVCSNCEEEIEVTGLISPEFFRPTE